MGHDGPNWALRLRQPAEEDCYVSSRGQFNPDTNGSWFKQKYKPRVNKLHAPKNDPEIQLVTSEETCCSSRRSAAVAPKQGSRTWRGRDAESLGNGILAVRSERFTLNIAL